MTFKLHNFIIYNDIEGKYRVQLYSVVKVLSHPAGNVNW